MAIVKSFDAYELKEEFARYNRDYFSITACQTLIDLTEETGCDIELDIVGLCCEFNEELWEDIKENYSNIEEIAECETIEELTEALNYYTWAVETEDDMILYQVF